MKDDKPLHCWPVCGALRPVRHARAQFAYGRQLTCGPDCETERRRRSRAHYRFPSGPVAGIDPCEAEALRVGVMPAADGSGLPSKAA
jgi:hypothetical protein